MKAAWLLFAIAVFGSLGACVSCEVTGNCPPASSAYASIKSLPPEDQERALLSLPIPDRLDAYHDVYIRSGHPRTILTEAFMGTGAEGFDLTLERMTDPRSFIEHFWIIQAMGLRREIDVCAPRFMIPLAAKLAEHHKVDPDHPVVVEFDGCELVI